MKNIKSALLMISLMFFLALTSVGCAQTGSDTMSGDSMETDMESMSDDTMDNMDAEKMDDGMDKNMQHGMK